MKLTYEQIKKIVKGTVRIVEEDGKICFRRFTDEQLNMYQEVNKDSFVKAFSTAGVRLEFVTDSKALALEAFVTGGSSRSYFNHDIYVNGAHLYSLGDDLDGVSGRAVTVRGEYELGDGEKTVKIYMPWSVCSKLVNLELDDGATLVPATRGIRMTSYGDSITHGYDASSPELSYASILADSFNADSVNKGIGAEIFYPALAALSGSRQTEIITVAYGTNDWSKGLTKEEYLSGCHDFYTNLSSKNPNAK